MARRAAEVAPGFAALELARAAALAPEEVLRLLGSSEEGIAPEEAARRLQLVGPNALRAHGTSGWRVLLGQLRNPLLPLLVVAAIVSGLTGQGADAAIVLVMVAVSVGLGFVNEYRSAKAVEALHDQVRHHATAVRARAGRAAPGRPPPARAQAHGPLEPARGLSGLSGGRARGRAGSRARS
jgi:Mg2+-importing ATPase